MTVLLNYFAKAYESLNGIQQNAVSESSCFYPDSYDWGDSFHGNTECRHLLPAARLLGYSQSEVKILCFSFAGTDLNKGLIYWIRKGNP